MEQELDAKRDYVSLNRQFEELRKTLNRSTVEYMRQVGSIDLSRSFQPINDTVLKYAKSEEFRLALRSSLARIRSQFDEVCQVTSESARGTVLSLIDAVDAFPVEEIDADAEIDVSECAETILAGMETARTGMTEEQRKDFDSFAQNVNEGKPFLTVERLLAFITLLVTIYTAICAYLGELSREETEKRKIAIAEETQRIEQAQLENGQTVLAALDALKGKLDALQVSVDFQGQVEDEDTPESTHDAPE